MFELFIENIRYFTFTVKCILPNQFYFICFIILAELFLYHYNVHVYIFIVKTKNTEMCA